MEIKTKTLKILIAEDNIINQKIEDVVGRDDYCLNMNQLIFDEFGKKRGLRKGWNLATRLT